MRASLARAYVSTSEVSSPVSAAKPTTTCPGRRALRRQLGKHVGRRSPARWVRSGASVFLILVVRHGLSDGSRPTRGGHDDASALWCDGQHRATEIRGGHDADQLRHRRGSGSATFARDDVTSAPRASGCRGERVALPARTSDCRGSAPGRGAPGSRRPTRRHVVRRGLASARRTAGRTLARARRARRLRQPARSGVGTGQPPDGRLDDESAAPAQRRDVGLGRRVLPHLRVHRRGVHDRAARVVSSVDVSRSSASPPAALASRSAVAGATTTRSASRPRRTWGTSCTSSQTSVATG